MGRVVAHGLLGGILGMLTVAAVGSVLGFFFGAGAAHLFRAEPFTLDGATSGGLYFAVLFGLLAAGVGLVGGAWWGTRRK